MRCAWVRMSIWDEAGEGDDDEEGDGVRRRRGRRRSGHRTIQK